MRAGGLACVHGSLTDKPGKRSRCEMAEKKWRRSPSRTEEINEVEVKALCCNTRVATPVGDFINARTELFMASLDVLKALLEPCGCWSLLPLHKDRPTGKLQVDRLPSKTKWCRHIQARTHTRSRLGMTLKKRNRAVLMKWWRPFGCHEPTWPPWPWHRQPRTVWERTQVFVKTKDQTTKDEGFFFLFFSSAHWPVGSSSLTFWMMRTHQH